MTGFSMVPDLRGQNSFGLVPSANKYNTTLAAGVAQTFTVPSSSRTGHWVAIMMVEPGATVWFALNTTAAGPGGAVASTSSELNPPVWQVSNGDTISAITADATAQVGIKFYESGR